LRGEYAHPIGTEKEIMSTKNVEIAWTRPPLSTLFRMILRSNIAEEDARDRKMSTNRC
jgi:hypothetical protein